jgi:chaperonin GroES
MGVRPLSDKVVVKRAASEAVTKGGIFIPDSATEKADQGTVVAVGPGRRLDNGTVPPVNVDVGDQVLFAKTSGQTVKVNGEELLILEEGQILGVITVGE